MGWFVIQLDTQVSNSISFRQTFNPNEHMTPLQDPGIQNGLNVLEYAPLIALVIAIPILIVGFLIRGRK